MKIFSTRKEVERALASGTGLHDGDLRNLDLSNLDLSNAGLFRADLRGARLDGANLEEVNLYQADLTGANLIRARLTRALLDEAKLGDAKLREAILHSASMRQVNLSFADLTQANLSHANLRGAQLQNVRASYASFCATDLRDADLADASLMAANVDCADLCGAKGIPSDLAARTFVPPSEGAFVAWKKLAWECIARLEVPADALRSSATSRKCRVSRALVTDILDSNGKPAQIEQVPSLYYSGFWYEVGKVVKPVSDFDLDRWNECASGIHCFVTRAEAEEYY